MAALGMVIRKDDSQGTSSKAGEGAALDAHGACRAVSLQHQAVMEIRAVHPAGGSCVEADAD